MNLDELQSAWQAYDRKLDAALRLNTHLVRESLLSRTRRALRRSTLLIVAGLIADFGVLVALGMFLAEHIDRLEFFLPAAALHLFTILLGIVSGQELVTLHTIDYDAPVVEIQKRVEHLRVQQITSTKWVLLTAPLLWTPLLVVSLKGLLGVNLYAFASSAWLIANVAFGVVFLVAMLWASKHATARSPLVRRLLADVGGANLRAARKSLDELAEFEV
jgi:hypothetical protein